MLRHLQFMSCLRHPDNSQRLEFFRQCLHATPMPDNKTMMNMETRANMASLDHGCLAAETEANSVTRSDQYADNRTYFRPFTNASTRITVV